MYQEKELTVRLSEALMDKCFQYRMPLITTDTGSGKTYATIRTAYLLDPKAHLMIFVPKAKLIEAGWDHSIAAFNEAMGSSLTYNQFSYSQLTSKSGPDDIKKALQNILHKQYYINVPVKVTLEDTRFKVDLKPYLEKIPEEIVSIRVEESPLKKAESEIVRNRYLQGDLHAKRLDNPFVFQLRIDTHYLEEADRPKIILILDEAHMIKLGTDGTISQRAKRCIELSKLACIDHCLGITATPAPNSPLDLGTYFVINGFYPSKSAYIQEHVRFFDEYHSPIVRDPRTKKVDSGYFKNYEQLERYIHEITVYTDTSYVLPDSQLETLTFDLDDHEQFPLPYFQENFFDETLRTRRGHYKQVWSYVRRGYFESSQQAMSVLRSIITADPERLRLMAKVTFEAFYGTDPHPVIIFYKHNLEKETIIDFFKNSPHFPDTRIQQINAHHKDVEEPTDPHTVILIQYQAGAAAIEFKTAYTSIFYMPTYSYGDFKQGQGRNKRSGMTGLVKQYILEAKDTSDEDIWRIIREKGNFTTRMENEYFTLEKED